MGRLGPPAAGLERKRLVRPRPLTAQFAHLPAVLAAAFLIKCSRAAARGGQSSRSWRKEPP